MTTTTSSRLLLARRRARARRRSAGAAMFIVAVTLGLLAVMGVYGLAATRADVRSAGHMREAVQGQKAGEHAMMMAAETFNPSNAYKLYLMTSAGPGMGQSLNCRTSATFTGLTDRRAAEACLKLDPTEMQTLAMNLNPFVKPAFNTDSFGKVTNLPILQVEITNPIDITVPNNSTVKYVQVTATVFTEMRPAVGVPAETVVVGRGRLTVGPVPGGQEAVF